jgi:hypothetical protein
MKTKNVLILISIVTMIVVDVDANTAFLDATLFRTFLDAIGCHSHTTSCPFHEFNETTSSCTYLTNGYNLQCVNGRISKIQMQSNGLTGTLSSVLTQFSSLTYMYIINQSIHSTIPPLPQSLSLVNLLNNKLSGTLPPFPSNINHFSGKFSKDVLMVVDF